MKTVDELADLVKYHKIQYYRGTPEISDHDYDSLEEELKIINPDHFVFKMVGSVIVGQEKIPHDKKMLSLEKTYDAKELQEWIDCRDTISMFKVDGVSCSLIYQNGNLVFAKTRGDGSFGENITSKVLWMNSIPKKITSMSKVEVRGELCCYGNDFINLSEEMVSKKLDRPTSPRNIVAGIVSRKENLELARFISFISFDIISEDLKFKREIDKFKIMKEMGFIAAEIFYHKQGEKVNDVINAADTFIETGEYQIDGLVFVLDDIDLHNKLGETAHHPRYKMAFKFKGETKKAEIEKIIWSVSRNGVLTPVAQIHPIDLSGAKISRVTLHNYGLVKQFNLKAGDKIEIIRSGEVIPKFLSVIEYSNNDFSKPDNCPSCKSKLFEEDIRLYCKNNLCPAKNKEVILNFIKKIGIDDLSSKRLDELIEKGLVREIEDLYSLKVDDFLKLDKFKEKLANKLYEAIQKSKDVTLKQFMASLGISGGAYNKCEKVIDNGFDSIDKIQELTTEKLKEIESFAEKSSQEFIKSLNEKKPLINKLLNIGFKFKSNLTSSKTESFLSGKKVCITGALNEKRSIVEQKIKDAGGFVIGSVSKNTDYLLTNELESTSSKFKKAKSLNVEIISEDSLNERLK